MNVVKSRHNVELNKDETWKRHIVRHCKTFIFTKFPSQNNIIIKIALQLEGVYIQKK